MYSLHNIIRTIKSRRMRWAGYVARVRTMSNMKKTWLGSLNERGNWEDTGIDWKVLKWILENYGWRMYHGFN
jgi:hypothetical protein